jgi:chromosome segregation protein
MAELGRLCEQAREETAAIEQKAAAIRAEEAEVRNAQAQLVEELGSLGTVLAENERALNDSENALFELGSQVEQIKARLVEALAGEAALKNEQSGLERQRESLGHKRARLAEERSSLETVTRKLEQDIDAAAMRLDALITGIQTAAGGKETVSARLTNVLARRTEAERRLETCRGELTALASRYTSIKELSDNFEGYGDGVRRFMSNGGRESAGALGVVAELIDIEGGYERAVAAVLEDRLQYVVVPDAEAGVRGAAYLRDTGAGRASFIPRAPRAVPSGGPNDPPPGYSLLSQHVSAKAGYEAVVETLLEDVVVAETLELATEQWKRNGTYVTFVTREGDVLDKAGVITGGSGRPLDEGLLARKAELRSLEDTLASARVETQAAEAALVLLRRESETASEELANLDRRLHELTVDRVATEGDLELHRQNLARTQERSDSVESELASLGEEDERLRERMRAITTDLSAVAASLRDGEGERMALETRRTEMESARRQRVTELESMRVREAELRQKREHSEHRLQGLRVTLEEQQSRVEMLTTRLAHDDTEVAAGRTRLTQPALDPAFAAQVAATAQERLEALQQALAQFQADEAALQVRMDEVSALRDQVREQRSASELGVKECNLELEAVESGVRERLGFSAAEVLAAVEARDEDLEAIGADLDRVRTALRRLGAVNIGAVTELAELETRLAEMTSQRDDLEKSIEDLRGTIARLNRLSRQRFKETFEAVNVIFQETFPRLFLGGKAWLALTDEANLLETGVEIYVRPPGKKVGNLDLLSGGEKALTAVSLIFSLFLHKPSPFCVLDEVDAPLDDANIGRFARMVADMSSRSQFVLITHNKKTMECCDMLYGVTMREPGVSKIVSVEMAS